MTREDILLYLDSNRKSKNDDPLHKWIGSYNTKRITLIRFFKWLYYQNVNSPKRRNELSAQEKKPACIMDIPQLKRKEISCYKPSDLWSQEDDLLFLKWVTNKRDRCYNTMARDLSAMPVRGLSDYVRIVEEMHFTHMRRRMLKVKPYTEEKMGLENEEPITLIVDASGLTVSKKGDYIEEKWIHEKKEFIKLHIAVDEKSKKVVSFRITKGNVHDTKKFGPLVREAAEKCDIDKVHADKAYDNRKNFNLLDDIEAAERCWQKVDS